jgi:FkbM family methyltransferase
MKLNDYIRTIRNEDKPLKFLIAKILIRLRLSTLFTVKRNGYRLRFYPSSYSRVLWINPNYENPVLDFVHDYLQGGGSMIDAGANIGIVTLEASLIVGQRGKIYSVEPHPKTFGFLQGNIALNHFTNIQIFNVALGNSHGDVLYSNGKSDDQNSIIINGDGIKVPIRPLDEIVNLSNISLLKIDERDMKNLSFWEQLGY